MSSKILFIWEAHCLAASNFSPVPRNDTVWGDFGQGVQADTGVQLVRLTSTWLYDQYGPERMEEDPLSPLTVHDELTAEGDLAFGDSNDSTRSIPTLPRSLLHIAFNLAHESHHSMPVHRLDAEDGISGYMWTETERARAKLAKEPRTMEELKEEVREHYCTMLASC